jgi:DNA-3-methyladenine glycosylase I
LGKEEYMRYHDEEWSVPVRDQGHDFSAWLWGRVDGKPIVNHYNIMKEIPSSTPLSTRISKIPVKRGFSFVCPTIVYAFMRASGFVNDHPVSCFRYDII